MMKYDVCILGVGRIGYAAAYDLKRLGYKILALDISEEHLKKIRTELDIDIARLTPKLDDLSRYKDRARLFLSSLPIDISNKYVEYMISQGINVVDVSSVPEDRIPLYQNMAKKSGCKAFLYAGVAPGMAQTLSGALYRELDGLDKLEIYVGGIPLDPEGKPLKTNITWNPLGFLLQYKIKCRKVVDGEVKYFDPFEDTGIVKLPGEGEYEYFISDGLKTLLNTLKDVPNMAEYTIRYKGHLKEMYLLREIGFLDIDPIDVDGYAVEPVKVTAKLFDKYLSKDPRDKTLLAVYGYSRDVEAIYYSYIYYNDELGMTGMQIATGFNLARYGHMLLDGIFEWEVILPEYIGLDDELFRRYLKEIDDAGINLYRVEERI